MRRLWPAGHCNDDDAEFAVAAGYPVPGPMSSEAPGPMSSEAPDSMSPSLAASGNSGNVTSSSIAASQLSVLVGLAIAFLTTPFF